MSEKRFGTKIDDVDSSIIVITDKCNDFAWFLSDVITDKQVEKVVALLNALDRDCNNLRIEKLQFENKCTTLEGENEQLKNDDLLFFQQVFGILIKYQHLFNHEMADEVLEDLGIELTEWFE